MDVIQKMLDRWENYTVEDALNAKKPEWMQKKPELEKKVPLPEQVHKEIAKETPIPWTKLAIGFVVTVVVVGGITYWLWRKK